MNVEIVVSIIETLSALYWEKMETNGMLHVDKK